MKHFLSTMLFLFAFLSISNAAEYTVSTNANESSLSGSGIKMVRTIDGKIHIVYRKTISTVSEIFYAVSSNNGQSWTETALTTSSGYAQVGPSIAADSNSKLHVVWSGNTSEGYYQIRYISKELGGSWSSISNLTSAAYSQVWPCLAVDSNDYLHLAWIGKTASCTTNNQIRYSKYTTSWSSPTEITSNDSYAQGAPFILVAPNNTIHILWCGSSGGSYVRTRSARYTSSWQTIQEPTNSVAYSESWVRGVADSNSNIHIATAAVVTTYSVFYNIWSESSDTWGTPSGITLSGWSLIQDAWLGINSSNKILLTGMGSDGTYFKLFYIDNSGSGWSSPTNLTPTDTDLQRYPGLSTTWWPTSGGVPVNQFTAGYCLPFDDQANLKFHVSSDMSYSNFIVITGETQNRHIPELHPRITISGTYAGATPTHIEAGIFAAGTSTPVTGCDWRTLVESPSGGTFSAEFPVDIPTGGPYDYKVRYSNNTTINDTSNYSFQVGGTLAVIGQSLGTNMFAQANSLVTPNSNVRFSYNGAWSTNSGPGIVEVLNRLSDETGKPWGAIHCSSDGISVYNYITTPATYYTPAVTDKLVAAFGDTDYIDLVIHLGTEGDAFAGRTKAQIVSDLGTYAGMLETTFGADIQIYAGVLGWTSYESVTDSVFDQARQATIEYCASNSNWHRACDKMDVPLLDYIHPSGIGMQLIGQRFGQYISYDLGLDSCGDGYVATNFNIIDTEHTDVNLDNDCGNDFAPTTSISGFEIYNGTSWVSATGVQQSSSVIRLTHATSTVSDVRYQYGKDPTITGPVLDDSTYELPLQYFSELEMYIPDEENPVVTILIPSTTPYYAGWSTSGTILSNDGSVGAISVSGAASDNVGVTSVTWACPNCTPSSGTATGTTTWSISGISLADKAVGDNVITVTATDQNANIGTDAVTVQYDANIGFALPAGYAAGDVGTFCYKVTERSVASGDKAYVGGAFPTTQLINMVGSYCMDCEVTNAATGLQFTTDVTNGWAGSFKSDEFFLQMKQDN